MPGNPKRKARLKAAGLWPPPAGVPAKEAMARLRPKPTIASPTTPKPPSLLRAVLAARGKMPPNPATAGLKGHAWFVACARLGGNARMASMTAEQRSALGRHAALKRWHPRG